MQSQEQKEQKEKLDGKEIKEFMKRWKSHEYGYKPRRVIESLFISSECQSPPQRKKCETDRERVNLFNFKFTQGQKKPVEENYLNILEKVISKPKDAPSSNTKKENIIIVRRPLFVKERGSDDDADASSDSDEEVQEIIVQEVDNEHNETAESDSDNFESELLDSSLALLDAVSDDDKTDGPSDAKSDIDANCFHQVFVKYSNTSYGSTRYIEYGLLSLYDIYKILESKPNIKFTGSDSSFKHIQKVRAPQKRHERPCFSHPRIYFENELYTKCSKSEAVLENCQDPKPRKFSQDRYHRQSVL